MFDWYTIPKWKSHFITDKLAVIASIRHVESQANVSCINFVPESTVCVWLKRMFISWPVPLLPICRYEYIPCLYLFVDHSQLGPRLWLTRTMLYEGCTLLVVITISYCCLLAFLHCRVDLHLSVSQVANQLDWAPVNYINYFKCVFEFALLFCYEGMAWMSPLSFVPKQEMILNS